MMRKFLVLPLLLPVAACVELPPLITYDAPVAAVREPDPPQPVEVEALPEPPPPPEQMEAIPEPPPAPPEPADPKRRVAQANAQARIEPARAGFIDAIQVFPYSEGALYQVYTSPGRITDIALQEGEELVEQGGLAAGDTARWVIGDTGSGEGASHRVHILVKPIRPDLPVNSMVINTRRRTYHLELRPTTGTYMAAVSWTYPQDRLYALQTSRQAAEAAQPIAEGIPLERLHFRYVVTGDAAPWKPARVFDDQAKVYIEFPPGIGQGEMPPLFVIGADGGAQLVNYRVRGHYYIVDRLFAAAELRLGQDPQQVVRIARTDGGARTDGTVTP
jgi:type IV secretion system protein VirB9